MAELLTDFLKNMGCSYCQEYEFQDNTKKEKFKSWKLYLKEYEMYSAMILYNDVLKKDISNIINNNDTICLKDINDDKNIILKLEFVTKSDDGEFSILVPTDEYQHFYEEIENMNKFFDKNINAYYIGTYNLIY